MKAQVTLYTKPGCHLCDEMKAEISKANCAGLYELREINIETDAELFARYRTDIPVLSINGLEAFTHRLSSADFRNYLNQLSA